MKCPKCNQDLEIKIATKVKCAKCKILTNLTSVITTQCDNCSHVFQVSIPGKSFLSLKGE